MVSWRPSYDDVDGPVTAYSVMACIVQSRPQSLCTREAARPVTISAATYDQVGYAVIHQLRDGKRYDFAVTAQSAGGSSTPSIPSAGAVPTDKLPRPPHSPKDLAAQAGQRCISLRWYPAAHDHGPPLAYIVTSSSGQAYTFAGLEQLVLAQRSGRAVHVIGGLVRGHRYRFSVTAIQSSRHRTCRVDSLDKGEIMLVDLCRRKPVIGIHGRLGIGGHCLVGAVIPASCNKTSQSNTNTTVE